MVFEYKGSRVLQNRDEIEKLAQIIKEQKYKIILEIGFYDGGTALYWNDIVEGGWIMSMDIRRPAVQLFEAVKKECEAKGNGFTFFSFDSLSPVAVQSVSLMLTPRKTEDNAESPEYGKVVSFGRDVMLDMLFIDGDHLGAAPLKDWTNYGRFVRPGGIIVFDDLNWPDVRYAFTEAAKGRAAVEFVSAHPDTPNWNGIGVVFV